MRRRDRVYVCSTGEGKVLELAFPNMTMVGGGLVGLLAGGDESRVAAARWCTEQICRALPPSSPHWCSQIRELPLFTLREHINTLGPTVDGKLWGVLHNLGASSLVQVGPWGLRCDGVPLPCHVGCACCCTMAPCW